MQVSFFTGSDLTQKSDVFVVSMNKDKPSEALSKLDDKLGGSISKAIEIEEFEGDWGKSIKLYGNAEFPIIYVLGTNKDKEQILDRDIFLLGARLAKLFAKNESISINLAELFSELNLKSDGPALLAEGLYTGNWQFIKYKEDKEKLAAKLKTAFIATNDMATSNELVVKAKNIADAVTFTREVVYEPGNVLYPETFAKKLEAFSEFGIDVEVWNEQQIQAKGMGAFYGVGQGSVNPPRMVVMHYNGGNSNEQPIALVGKGVTFDSGGISLKPGKGMEGMIMDMGGAAAVSGAMLAIAKNKLPINVVAIVGLAENMPDGNAQRPGDIVTTYSGKTVEVYNTDAEGRLILADCITYAIKDAKAKSVIDVATLTGAMLVALGIDRAGLFSNNDELAANIFDSGEETGEFVWRMPCHDSYNEYVKGKNADLCNIPKIPYGSSITAAKFLENFADDTPWVHLDVAPVYFLNMDRKSPFGDNSGFGVRLLHKLIEKMALN